MRKILCLFAITAALAGSGAVLPLPIAPTQTCDPSLTPGRQVKPEVTITSPSHGGTASWPSFVPTLSYKVGASASGVTFLLDGKEIATEVRAPFQPVFTSHMSGYAPGST